MNVVFVLASDMSVGRTVCVYHSNGPQMNYGVCGPQGGPNHSGHDTKSVHREKKSSVNSKLEEYSGTKYTVENVKVKL